MKRLLLILVSMIFGISVSFGQAVTADEKTHSKIEQFSAETGRLFEKKYIDVGSINREVTVQVLVLSDLVTGWSIKGVRLQYDSYLSRTGAKSAVLDADEIDGLIKSINILKSNVFNTAPTDYTEVIYTSRSGFSAGAYYSKKKWITFLKLEKFDSESSVTMGPEAFDRLLSILQSAKEMLK